MDYGDRTVVLKDSTMREGQDVPGVTLDPERKRVLLKMLADARVPEVELVSPGHFERDLNFVKESGSAESTIRISGLIYGHGPDWREQIGKAKGVLDRVDILTPLADGRPPAGRASKALQMREALRFAIDVLGNVGAGFPHATQVERQFLLEMCDEAVRAGVNRITLYDTNGSSDPWAVGELVESVRESAEVVIGFHAHNDLGMATANSIAAVRAGATCLDVTVNGLGDRAGNASLEQVALVLHTMGKRHGLKLDMLRELSRTVEAMTLVPISKLAPVVGEFVFIHKSPGHLVAPSIFEAFDPDLVGGTRSVSEE